jgi:16S rRNA (adenine1518-N6/adenine1519-N6)-dimethyltransferase
LQTLRFNPTRSARTHYYTAIIAAKGRCHPSYMSIPECIATRAGTRAIIEQYGLSVRKKLGQHFLVDPFVLGKIIRTADIGGRDVVLEVGPGIGAVTQALALGGARHVLAVELDTMLVPVLQAMFAQHPVTVVQGDILRLDLPQLLAPYAGYTLKVVANLPYYVTTAVVMHLLESGLPFETITVMVQKEVAERMAAVCGTAAYGSLSLAVQFYATAKVAANVPPNCFMPRPAVDSAVVHLQMRPAAQADVDKEALFAVIHAAFNQRRKTLVNALSARLEGFDKEQIVQAVALCGLPASIRGEALSMAQFAAVTQALFAARPR